MYGKKENRKGESVPPGLVGILAGRRVFLGVRGSLFVYLSVGDAAKIAEGSVYV